MLYYALKPLYKDHYMSMFSSRLKLAFWYGLVFAQVCFVECVQNNHPHQEATCCVRPIFLLSRAAFIEKFDCTDESRLGLGQLTRMHTVLLVHGRPRSLLTVWILATRVRTRLPTLTTVPYKHTNNISKPITDRLKAKYMKITQVKY